MPYNTLIPDGIGTYPYNGAQGGAIGYNPDVYPTPGPSAVLAISTLDDDSSYIGYPGGAGGETSWTATGMTALVVAEIRTVTICLRVRGVSAHAVQWYPFVRLAGTDVFGTPTNQASQNYANISSAVARPGGGSWLRADIGSIEIGARETANSSSGGQLVTHQWASIDYALVPGGFVTLIGSLAGAALLLSEMPGLARQVYRRTRARITPGEYAAAWRELREWRYPRHIVLG